MKKDLMKNNCYDVEETMCIMGSCFMSEEELGVKNYVATDKGLEEIPFEVISLSKNLSGLKETLKNKK